MNCNLVLLVLAALVAAACGSPRRLTRDEGVPGGELGAVECRRATIEVWHLPYPGDCTKFIKCDIIGNLSTIYTCDSPLHFNTQIQTCDWPENAGCEGGGNTGGNSGETTTKGNTGGNSGETTPKGNTDEGDYDVVCANATPEVWHLPYPGDCTKFIKCDYIGKLYTVYTCDSPLHFNPSIQTCDWPENAGCETSPPKPSSSVKPPTQVPTSPKPSSSVKPPVTPDDVCASATDDRWHLPYPGDCTKFIKCDLTQNTWTVHDCPSPLHFNAEIQVCDWPANAGCSVVTPSVPTPTSGSPSTASTPDGGCETTTQKKESCESSSSSSEECEPKCTEATKPAPTCPDPKPTPSPSPDPTPVNPPTGGNKCPAPFGPGDVCRVATEHFWHIADPTDSTRFYKCEIASCRAFLFDCPAGLVFNQSIQVCDWP